MISIENSKKFCCEDISLVENYKEAVKSSEQYDLHHKLGLWFNKQWLKDNGFYYEQRAEMLIFMKETEHVALHNACRKWTKESIQKMIESQKNNSITSKKVYQYTLDGKLVAEYPSAKEAFRQTGFDHSRICACCTGRSKTAYGFKWSHSPIVFTEIEYNTAKKVCQLALDGTLIKVWGSAAEVERCLKLKHTNISCCCRGKHKTCGGFRWCYFSVFNQ